MIEVSTRPRSRKNSPSRKGAGRSAPRTIPASPRFVQKIGNRGQRAKRLQGAQFVAVALVKIVKGQFLDLASDRGFEFQQDESADRCRGASGLRPTWSDVLARPWGQSADFEFKSTSGVASTPAASTIILPRKAMVSPCRRQITCRTLVPSASSRSTVVSVKRRAPYFRDGRRQADSPGVVFARARAKIALASLAFGQFLARQMQLIGMQFATAKYFEELRVARRQRHWRTQVADVVGRTQRIGRAADAIQPLGGFVPRGHGRIIDRPRVGQATGAGIAMMLARCEIGRE